MTLITAISQYPSHGYYSTEGALWKILVLYSIIQQDWLNASKTFEAETYTFFSSLTLKYKQLCLQIWTGKHLVFTVKTFQKFS